MLWADVMFGMIHSSGTDGLDSTCCGSDAPSCPASKYWRGQFAGVIRLVITTGETASRVVVSVIVDPAGIVASGMSRGGDRSIKLPSDDMSSQSSTAARIVTISDWGWAEVTNDALNLNCSWSKAALKNRRKGAYSGPLVITYWFRSS